MSDLEQYTDEHGEVRKLGWVKPPDDVLKMRADTSSITAQRPMIPRSEWFEVDFISPLGRRCINNQRSCGGCTGWSAAQASMRQRLIRGLDFQRLSGAAIYAQINGGRDNGSNIRDSMDAIEQNGTCLESEMDFPSIYPKQIPRDKLRFKEDSSVKVTIDMFDEWALSLMMGGLPQGPLNATQAWVQNRGYDSDGVAEISGSKNSNHSVHGAGLVQYKPGSWGIIMPNTWGLGWGPWTKQNPPWYDAFIARNNITPIDALPLAGCCLIVPDHIDNCDRPDDGYTHLVSLNPSSTLPGAAA